MPHPATPAAARFGEFELDLSAHELRKDGRRVHLQEKSFQLLLSLLAREGEAVTREELRRALWPADTHVEFDDSLNHVVRRLREALDDVSGTPRFIETIPRVGYRFIAPVERAGAVRPAPSGRPDPETDPGRAGTRTQPDRRVANALTAMAAAGALGAIVLLGSDDLLRVRPPSPPRANQAATTAAIESVAVLPFENLSADPEGDLFAAGLTDSLITDLARLTSLRVISRRSVVAYRKPATIRAIGRDLQVDAIIEGTIQRSGERLRVSAWLVDTRTDHHLWAERFDRDIRDMLALQDDLVRAIAGPVDLIFRSTGSPAGVRPLVPEAYLAYRRGRFLMDQPTPSALESAIVQFRRSTAADPDFALAHAWMARTYVRAAHDNRFAPAVAFAEAARAARRALAIDPSLSDAEVALASTHFLYDWDWTKAEQRFRSALQRVPNDPEAHAAYADLLSALGRFDEAIREAEQAVRVDPVSHMPSAALGLYYYLARRYDEAMSQARRVLALEPEQALARLTLGFALIATGEAAAGRVELERVLGPTGESPYAGVVGHARAAAGDAPGARAVLRELRAQQTAGYLSPVQVAIVHAALGERDAAFAWLEKAYAGRDHDLAFINVWPMYDPLRDDPRFGSLVRRMNLP